MAIPNKCPLCSEGTENQNVITKHVYGGNSRRGNAFFHCKNCDVIYQFPGLTEEEEKNFYTKEFEGFMNERSSSLNSSWLKADEHNNKNIDTFQRRMKYLNQFVDQKKKILEIGCSSGFMLLPLIKMGHECTGIEPSGVFSEYLLNKNIPIFNSLKELMKNQSNEKYDLIMHFFVLEHISNPIQFLKQQISLLKPGGILIFEIPNAADPLFSIYDIPEFERFYWSIAHPWYFSEKSLNFLLKKVSNNFEIKLDQRYDFSNHIIWARDGKPGGMGLFSKKMGSKFDEFYKENLIANHTCDTLIGIIKN